MSPTINNHSVFIYFCLFFLISFFLGTIGKNFTNNCLNLVNGTVLLIIYQYSSHSIFDRKVILWSLLSVICIFLSYIFVGGGLGSVIGNLNLVIFINVFYNSNFTYFDFSKYSKGIRCFNIYLLIYVMLYGYFDGYFGGINANAIGLQALLNFAVICVMPCKSKFLQGSHLLIAIYIVLLSNSRTSLLIMSLFCFLVIFLKVTNKYFSLRLSIVCYWILILFAVAYTFIYTFTLNEFVFFEQIMNYSLENFDKSIYSGREYIWESSWNHLLASPFNLIWGIGSHFYSKGEFDTGSNFHNSFLTIVICCGFLGYYVIMKLFSFLIRGNRLFHQTSFSFVILCFPIMLVGYSESVLFSGNFAIQVFMLICICQSLTTPKSLIFDYNS